MDPVDWRVASGLSLEAAEAERLRGSERSFGFTPQERSAHALREQPGRTVHYTSYDRVFGWC